MTLSLKKVVRSVFILFLYFDIKVLILKVPHMWFKPKLIFFQLIELNIANEVIASFYTPILQETRNEQATGIRAIENQAVIMLSCAIYYICFCIKLNSIAESGITVIYFIFSSHRLIRCRNMKLKYYEHKVHSLIGILFFYK